MSLSKTQVAEFRATVYEYYEQYGRHDMPWRQPEADGSFDPYKIMVSEVMLQQTQVSRVIPKYQQFLELFPTIEALAQSSLAAVLTAWSGLGYNRRAKFLHQAAKMIIDDFDGTCPSELSALVKLPGVGNNTAGAIVAYAFNQPVSFIETNVRTVYIHHFFADREGIRDAELQPYLELTLDRVSPRQFYWGLMDYGTHLKQIVGNLNKLSIHYARPARFQGSNRQIRGQIIRELALQPRTQADLKRLITDARLGSVLADLQAEKLIKCRNELYALSE